MEGIKFLSSCKLNEIKNLDDYLLELRKYKDQCLICAAVKDTLHGIDEESVQALREFGMENIVTGWNGYVFMKDGSNVILDKKGETDSSVLEYIQCYEMRIQLVSKSFHAGNKSMIVVDDYDFAVNARGLNIVVLDIQKRILVDAVCFDFFPQKKTPCIRHKDFMQIKLPNTRIQNGDDFFDIDDELENIIETYHFDKYHPRYSKFRKAREYIEDLSNEWDVKDSVACILVGYSLEKMEMDKRYFLSNIGWIRRNQIDFYQSKFKERLDNPPPSTYVWDACDCKSLEHVAWESYRHVYIISNCGDNFVGEWLRRHKVRYISLYDYFLEHGIYDIPEDSEYYNFIVDKRESRFMFSDYRLHPSVWEIYEDNLRHQEATSYTLKLIYAKKLFFLCLVNRDFIVAKKFFDEIISSNHDVCEYRKGWIQIENLLYKIHERVKIRKGDLIAIWVDYVGYEDTIKLMPFISSLRKSSIWFNNFFSMNGFTRETLRAIFTGRKLIEDQTNNLLDINLYNSPLLRVLEKNNYTVSISGKYLQDLLRLKYASQRTFSDRESESLMLWDAMRTMLMVKTPCFMMLHCLQSHFPYVFAGLDGTSMFSRVERRKSALSHLDGQIKFYLDILGENTTSIIFNDHGSAWYWPRQHVFFAIKGSIYRHREINDICSMIDFHKVVEQLIESQEITEAELSRNTAEFQGVPVLRTGRFTNPRGLLTEAIPAYWPIFRGYKGIVTKEYVYIYFAGGREWLSRRDKLQPQLSWYARPDDICNVELLPEMRKKAGIDYGNEPPDYGPRSEYYMSIQEAYEKNYPYNEVKLHLINSLVARLPNALTALYLGDHASREAYLSLSLANRKKLVCIIHKTPDCPCSEFGLPVIPLEKMTEYGVRQVLVMARSIPKELGDFLKKKGQGIHAFGIYGWFEVNGYHTRHNFYDFAIQSMDAPLPSPTSIPDFLHFASGDSFCEIAVVVVVQDEKTLLDRLHGILKQAPLGIRVYCLDLAGKAADRVKEYQNIDTSIEVVPVDGYPSLSMKMNELLTSVNAKYILFLSSEEYLHGRGLFYLHEIAEQAGADVVAASAAVRPSKDGEASLASFFTGAFPLRKEARILSATYKERYEEWERMEIPEFYGIGLYRLDFLRQQGIKFSAMRSGWEDIFCYQTIFLSSKYIKVASPVCISSEETPIGIMEENLSKYGESLVESTFRYQQEMEDFIRKLRDFGSNPSMCDAFRERAMTIFDRKYFSRMELDDEMRNSICQKVQMELQKKPAIGMWWIKYLFLRSSFPYARK